MFLTRTFRLAALCSFTPYSCFVKHENAPQTFLAPRRPQWQMIMSPSETSSIVGAAEPIRSHLYCATPKPLSGHGTMYKQPAIHCQCLIRLTRRFGPEPRNPENNPPGCLFSRLGRSYHPGHRAGNESGRGPHMANAQLWNAERPNQPLLLLLQLLPFKLLPFQLLPLLLLSLSFMPPGLLHLRFLPLLCCIIFRVQFFHEQR